MQVDPIKPTLKGPGTKHFETKICFKTAFIFASFFFQFQYAPLHPGLLPHQANSRGRHLRATGSVGHCGAGAAGFSAYCTGVSRVICRMLNARFL